MLHAEMLGMAAAPSPAAPAGGEGEAPPPPPHSSDLDTLLEQGVIAVGNYVQASLLNRARQRRRLRRGCEDMANLYQHALIAEGCPLAGAKLAMGGWRWRPLAADDPQGPLATWVEKETAWHMVSHLLMGFELELVEAGEVPMLYWYADFLLATCAQNLAALSAARPNPDRQQIYRDQVMFEALRPMCQATFRLGLALNACGAIAGVGGGDGAESSSFATDAERFEMRFGFFGTSVERPEPLVFAQYQAAADISTVPLARLAELAAESFMRAKSVCDLAVNSADKLGLNEAQIAEFKSLARSASANLVAAGMVKRALESGGVLGLEASYELKGHRAFPVASLKSKKKR
jgi:hypothetical protein